MLRMHTHACPELIQFACSSVSCDRGSSLEGVLTCMQCLLTMCLSKADMVYCLSCLLWSVIAAAETVASSVSVCARSQVTASSVGWCLLQAPHLVGRRLFCCALPVCPALIRLDCSCVSGSVAVGVLACGVPAYNPPADVGCGILSFLPILFAIAAAETVVNVEWCVFAFKTQPPSGWCCLQVPHQVWR